jgi:hypothetical protein
MVFEPDDDPKPYDEPDGERYDDDEPEPGTMYFGEDDGRMDGPILLKPNITPQSPGGADAGPANEISLLRGPFP